MRIAGVRLDASAARLLAVLLEREGYPATAARVAGAIELGVTIEAPLTVEDHDAIVAALRPHCPATLHRLSVELAEEQRRRRFVTGA